MRIGMIGTGSIGMAIANALLNREITDAKLIIVGDIIETPGLRQISKEHGCVATTDIKTFLDHSLDLAVEAASQEAAKKYLPLFLKNGVDVMTMSVGALVSNIFYEEIEKLAAENDCQVYVPSGAVGCLDLLLAARVKEIKYVTLTTRKPPASLEKVTDTQLHSYEGLKQPLVVFEGTARDAVEMFPKNVNVAGSLSLAGIGPDLTTVKIIADPNVKDNIHEVEVEGEFGRFKVIIENRPSLDNPKTSYLACLSSIAMLKKIGSRIKIG